MPTESAFGAQRGSYAGAPTGFRRLTPGLLQADRAAEHFDGLPEGVEVHGQLLAAFKAAAPRLGLSIRLIHALDWLFRFTQPQDWQPGRRPIVWPSAAMQGEAFGLSESGVRHLNRGLIDAGLITMKDSPSGKRYGMRDREGDIVEAYGFDLSPIATRYAQFMRLAAEAKAEREMIGRLRRRATIARKAITQILETVAEFGFAGAEWPQLRRDSQALVKSLRAAERSEEIAIGVGSLERRQTEARLRLEQLLETLDSAGKPAENNAHNIRTNSPIDSNQDNVLASQGCKSTADPALSDLAPQAGQQGTKDAQSWPGSKGKSGGSAEPEAGQKDQQRIPPPGRTDSGTVMRLSIDELMHLAPRLRTYLKSPRPAWPEIVDAADWLRGELGISRSLWGDACVAMGRERAAIAIAIVSAKPTEHFRSTPGGYFNGMVVKARAGELNLERTIWGLRQTGASPVHAKHGPDSGSSSTKSQGWH